MRDIVSPDNRIPDHECLGLGAGPIAVPLVVPVVAAQFVGQAIVRFGLKFLKSLPKRRSKPNDSREDNSNDDPFTS